MYDVASSFPEQNVNVTAGFLTFLRPHAKPDTVMCREAVSQYRMLCSKRS